MLTLRPAAARGHANLGWLDSHHTFSFGNYYDPQHMSFSHLRVINEDTVAPGQGFPTHGHRDMEIVTYILSGELEHKDSMGNGSVIRPGDVQRMSAGTGIQHSEYNPSSETPVHLLQIWLLPEQIDLKPSYEQQYFSQGDRQNQLCLIGSRDGRAGSVTIHQDSSIYAGLLDAGATVRHSIAPDRSLWIQVARGAIDIDGQSFQAGDGIAVRQATEVSLTGHLNNSEILLFDLVASLG